MSNEILTLELHPSHIKSIQTIGSAKNEKVIDYKKFSDLFTSEGNTDTGFLPGEYGTQRIVVKNGVTYTLYLEPAKIIDVHHENTEQTDVDEHIFEDDYEDEDDYYDARDNYILENKKNTSYKFTTPILCWMVATRGNRCIETFLFAMKTPILTGMEPLFEAPFENIFGDGKICWGHNDVNIPTPKAIQGLSTLFFNADANMDLADRRFDSYQRKYFPGTAFYPIHLHMDVDKMLKEETPEKTLGFVNSVLLERRSSLNTTFDNFVHNNI